MNKSFKGDGHHYELDNFENGSQPLQFIEKEQREPEGALETLHDGTTNEAVLGMMVHRLEFLNEKMPSVHNLEAINHVKKALRALEERTQEREERGVEGTSQA